MAFWNGVSGRDPEGSEPRPAVGGSSCRPTVRGWPRASTGWAVGVMV